jgi:hypothetical protein
MDELIYERRDDLLKFIPWGGKKRMTEIMHVTPAQISKVLHGHINANTPTNRLIIVLAEQMVTRQKNKQNSNFNIGLHDYSARF